MVNIFVKDNDKYVEFVTNIIDDSDALIALCAMSVKEKVTIEKAEYRRKNGERYINIYLNRG